MKAGDLVKLNPDVLLNMASHIGVVTKVVRAGASVEVIWANNLVTVSVWSSKLIKVSK